MAGRKTISVVIDATENLSAKARKGAEALQGVGKKGKAGLSKVKQWAARAEKQLKRLAPVADKIKRALKAVGILGAAAMAGLLAIGVKCLKMFGVQQDAVIGLEAAMRSAGNYTPELSKRYQDLAASLQQVTKYGDEAIMPLMGMLTQIGKVSEKDMPRATEAVLDLSEAMGVDLKAGALLVAKAAAGEISMLKRYGIMVDMQKYKTEGFSAVLDALSSQFGGTARAKALTLTGAYTQLKNKIGDMFELVGKKLAPVARLLIDAINPVIDGISEWLEKSISLNVIISETAKFANFCAQTILGLGTGFTGLLKLMSIGAHAIGRISKSTYESNMKMLDEWDAKIGAVAVELDLLTKKIEEFMLGGKVPEDAGKKGTSVLAGLDLSDVIPTEEIEEAAGPLQIFLDKLDQIKEAAYRKDIEALAESALNVASNFELVNERLPRTAENLEAIAELQAKLSAEFDKLGKELERTTVDVTGAVQDTIGNTFMAIGDFVANVVAGVSGAGKKLAATVLNVFGTMAQQIGAMVVATALALSSLKSLSLVAGLGYGIALIAMGGVLKGIASRLSAQATAAPAAGGGGGGAGAGYFRQPAARASMGPAPETRFFFITDSGRPREGSRHEAESYLERTLQGSTKRTLKRMVRTDEIAFS